MVRRRSLLLSTFLAYSTVLLLVFPALAATSAAISPLPPLSTAPCPSHVEELLASSVYTDCRADIPSSAAAWVFTADNTDALVKSEACSTTLRALQDIPFEVCITTITINSDTIPTVQVTIDKHVLNQIHVRASRLDTTRRRRLRPAADEVVTRLLADSGDMNYDYKYLYIGIGISVLLMVLCCVASRGGVVCCCIPIPICW